MKAFAKRSVSFLLTVAMLAGLLPYALGAPSRETPEPLAGQGIALPEDAEGTFLAFAANAKADGTPAASWELEERGRYALTICRAGDLSGETTVELRTIDLSASYGEDYRLDDPRYDTEVYATGGTLMEQYSGSEEAKADADAAIEEMARQRDAARDAEQADGSVPQGTAHPAAARASRPGGRRPGPDCPAVRPATRSCFPWMRAWSPASFRIWAL
ncbi:MAG: hypothetical protein IKD79_06420 [Oscillospiraceae bacterium]|nr:hypothetical protein [Oscillospiraceae bacterium]